MTPAAGLVRPAGGGLRSAARLDQFRALDTRVFTAHGASTPAGQRNHSPARGQGVVREQAIRQKGVDAEQILHRLRRLDYTDTAGDCADHPNLLACRQVASGWGQRE
jgi:hypothetical protein